MRADIVGGDRFGTIHRKVEVARRFIEAVRSAHAFEPVCCLMLGMGNADRAGDRAMAPDQPNQQAHPHQDDIERQEKRVVKTGDDQPNRALQDDGEGADDQAGYRLLHHNHVEIAVEQAAAAFVGEKGVLRMDGTYRHLGDDPGKDAALEHCEQIDAQCAQTCYQQH